MWRPCKGISETLTGLAVLVAGVAGADRVCFVRIQTKQNATLATLLLRLCLRLNQRPDRAGGDVTAPKRKTPQQQARSLGV